MNPPSLPGRALAVMRAPQLVSPRQYLRVAARCVYLAALIGTVVTMGIPADRVYQAAWIVAGLIAFAIDRPWRGHVRVVVDWLPLVAALVVYDHTRGIADELGLPVRVHEPVAVESWLFGGTVPTVWLQERLLGADGERPGWTMITAVVYTSHFLVPWLLAALLYLYSRSRWAGYMRRVLLLSYFGLITYILVPAAHRGTPPRWACCRTASGGSPASVSGWCRSTSAPDGWRRRATRSPRCRRCTRRSRCSWRSPCGR